MEISEKIELKEQQKEPPEECLLTKKIMEGTFLSPYQDSELTEHLKTGCAECEEKLKNHFELEIKLINNCSSKTRATIIWGVLMQLLPRPVRIIFYQHFKKCFSCKGLFLELTQCYREIIVIKKGKRDLREKIQEYINKT